MTIHDKIKHYLSLCTHRQCVEFALYCAKDAARTSKSNNKKTKKCIDLIEKWLINPKAVTGKELHDAVYSDYVVAHSDNCAAYAAAHAVHSANFAANYAAHSANYAAHAAANAAHAANYAAHAAAHAVHSIRIEDKQKEQLKYLLMNVLKLTEFDKLMANI
jgi:hypothetical protein